MDWHRPLLQRCTENPRRRGAGRLARVKASRYTLRVRRLIALSLAALTLAACGEEPGRAFLDTRAPPSLGPRFWAPDGWAWGVVRIEGAPEIRYGVASPLGRPVGHVVFVTGYGESAEVYFETARALIADGYAVWVMEPHGQAGSGRFRGARDVGRSAGFDRDAAALRKLVEEIVRPSRDDRLVIAGTGSGALPVLMAVQGGLRHVDTVFLNWPDLAPERTADEAAQWNRFGGGFLRARGGEWRRPPGDIRGRATLPEAWQTANPDLRMGGPGWSWVDARSRALRQVTATAALAKVDEQVVIITAARDATATSLCRRLPNCVLNGIQASQPGHLARGDGRWKAWLDFLRSRLGEPGAAHER